ncbi:MAG: 50S ribosomal protein L4 [Acidimicrobiales bacterium]|nr:50S ribosomal protein L4 [Acidimicrobiales bacterium]
MAKVDVVTTAGKSAGKADLDDAIFGIEPNIPVMHQVVTAQLAARRAGTHSTKTRAERRGGGAKPWRQKGTGRARQGSIRSPQWRGGGVAHGPKPRDYSQRTPKKMIKLALRSALSDRAADGKVIVVDSFDFSAPKTAEAVKVLSSLEIEGRALVVLSPEDTNVALSFRNLSDVHVLPINELNAYDVLVSDYVIFTKDSLPSATAADTTSKASATESKKKTVEDGKEKKTVEDGKPASTTPTGPEESSAAEETDESSAAEETAASTTPTGPEESSAAEETDESSGAEETGSHAPLDDDSMPEGFPIKGNADSMKYHEPDGRWYENTVAEVWFATVEAAEAAGFTKAGARVVSDEEE